MPTNIHKFKSDMNPKQELPPDHPFRKMTKEQRLANLAKGRAKVKELEAQGLKIRGRPAKLTAAEARRVALSELEPQAIRVLRERLASTDEKVSMNAALRILEWQWGKAAQTVVNKDDDAVEFSSAVLDVLTNKSDN